jgi:hypothetical protein
MTAAGVWCYLDWDTDTTSLKLYDTDGSTVLGTVSLLTAARASTANRILYAPFAAPVNLAANTSAAYRIVAETNNTSSTAAGVIVATAIVANHMDMLSLGTACYHTSYNGTSWTDTDTKRAYIGLLVSKIDDGLGGGRANYLLGM